MAGKQALMMALQNAQRGETSAAPGNGPALAGMMGGQGIGSMAGGMPGMEAMAAKMDEVIAALQEMRQMLAQPSQDGQAEGGAPSWPRTP